MSPLSNVLVNISDGALGLNGDSGHPLAFISTAATGTVNQVTPVGDLSTLKTIFRSGRLVELLGFTLALSGGPHYGVRCNASNAGSNGAITKTAAVGSTGPDATAVTVTGTPLDDYEVMIRIVKGGERGTATFQVSFDGGDSWSEEYLTAASVATWATDTGLTFLFATDDGTPPPTYVYFAGDVYAFTATGPTYSASDLNDALNALHASPYEFEAVVIGGTVGGVDDATKVTNMVALATQVKTKMAAWEVGFRYAFALMQAPNVTAESALAVSAVTNLVSERLAICYGDIEIASQVTDNLYRRNCIFSVAQRIAKVDFQRSIAAVRDGTLEGVKAIYRDERLTPGLEDLRFIVLRTFDNALGGYYTGQGKTFAAAGSDFTTIERRRVMDRTCKMARRALLPFLEEDLELNANGTIDERTAVAIETDVRNQLAADLIAPKRVSDVGIVINRTDNLASTETLRVQVRERPRPKARWITADISFINPFQQGT
jgi:hypothetical protein